MALPQEQAVPSWVDIGAGITRGQDLLGLRRSVQAVGEGLLDGITTITPTIRYVTFRAWATYTYSLLRMPDDRQSFSRFWERFEAALALGNLLIDKHIDGVIGTNEARKLIGSAIDPIPLKQLVKQSAARIYGGASNQLSVSYDGDSEIPGLTKERGLLLAEELDHSFRQAKLVKRIESGEEIEHASIEELTEFGSVCSVSIIPDNEAKILISCLMPESPLDYEVPRLATYTALLAIAGILGREPKDKDLFEASLALTRTLPEELEGILDGWIRYSVRDAISLAHEKVLFEILETIRNLESADSSPVHRDDAIQNILGRVDDHNDTLNHFGLIEQGDSFLEYPFTYLYNRISEAITKESSSERSICRWSSEINETNLIGEIQHNTTSAIFLLPVIWILACLRDFPSTEANGILSRQGWARIGLSQVIRPNVKRFLDEAMTVGDVLQLLITRTVDQHLRVSWARLAADPKRDVSLMICDEDHWIRRSKKKFSANRTASRIRQSVGWLRQLGLVDSSGLTAEGQTLLHQSLQILRRSHCESS